MAFKANSENFPPKTSVYGTNVEYIAWLNILHRGSAYGMKLREQLGLNIQEARRSREISQEDLAHRANIDRGYIGKIEAIAKALEIEPMELLKRRK